MLPVFSLFPLLGYRGDVPFLCIHFDCTNFHFWKKICFLVSLLNYYLVGFFNWFFYKFACCSFSGYSLPIGTFLVSAYVNGLFNWYVFLIWVSSWFTCRSLSWYAPSTVTLGGAAGYVDFPNIFSREVNASLFAFSIITSGLAGAGFYSAWIKSCAELFFSSVLDIFGMLNFQGWDSNVS